MQELQFDKVILTPPTDTNGVTLYINGHEFVAPVSLARGQEVTISFRKKGMLGRIMGTNQMEHKLVVNDTMRYQMPQLEWFRLISYQMIQVKSESGVNVPYRLYINNREVTNGYGVYVREADLERVQIRVEGAGYVNFDDAVNFVGKDSVEIVLEKEGNELVLLIDGVEFSTRSGRMINTINVDGHEFYQMGGGKYRLQKRPGYLNNDPKKGPSNGDWLAVVLVALVCLVVGVLSGWAIFSPKEAKVIKAQEATYPSDSIIEAIDEFAAEPEPMDIKTKPAEAPQPLEEVAEDKSDVKADEKKEDVKKEEPKKDEQKAEEPAPAKTKKVFAELYDKKNNDGTEISERRLEAVPELKGLYAALAYYRRDEILNKYAPLIDANDPKMASWAKLVKAVRECPDVRFSAKGYAITGNQSHNITIEKYITMIRKKQADAKKG
ncbi:MAG: hypothetical protein II588_04925 [Paludibacteraceae bacterium]|nr:hypothetical protein [Paludibacteraceae bacterium]